MLLLLLRKGILLIERLERVLGSHVHCVVLPHIACLLRHGHDAE